MILKNRVYNLVIADIDILLATNIDFDDTFLDHFLLKTKKEHMLKISIMECEESTFNLFIEKNKFENSFIKFPTFAYFFDEKSFTGYAVFIKFSNIKYIYNFIRISLSYYLCFTEKGVLLHSAALVVNGNCYLFPARSGVGKSTLTKKAVSNGALVLSDDAVVLRKQNGVIFAYPFLLYEHLDMQVSDCFKLKKVFILRHADKVFVTAIGKSNAVSYLFADSFIFGECYKRKFMHYYFSFFSDFSSYFYLYTSLKTTWKDCLCFLK